ncbi:hypothetical protein Vretimale_11709 [Volvox reticuliferus]|nr:hypothetical protein Vretifemale_20220 [Volvox reticuliferus]GIM07634.1 hypothetical protein Vretimale_11709 [Volvox reticuliferus]
MTASQLVGLDYEAFVNKGGRVPDVVLVRKSYEDKRRKRQAKGGTAAGRAWKLKTLDMEVEDNTSGPRGRNEAVADADRERFLQELEEDPDMRARINIYKDAERLKQQQVGPQQQQQRVTPVGAFGDDDDDEDDDEDLPQIPLEELLDDLEGLNLEEGGRQAAEGRGEDGNADMDMD